MFYSVSFLRSQMGKYIKNPTLLKIKNAVQDVIYSVPRQYLMRRTSTFAEKYDIIQGERFEKLADNERIFYRHTHEVNNFFRDPPAKEFVLISHNSDRKVTENPKEDGDADITLMPPGLVKWFSQNVDVEHDKVESIPIGLENSRWFPAVRKIEKIISRASKKKNFINWLYLNHNVKTNPQERTSPYALFKNKGWCTLESGGNNYKFDHYLAQLYNHRFVLSPEGNGMDTHRAWEALYLNTIPIEKRNNNNRFYTDLPICFVDDWEEVTLDFLEREYERINRSNWNLEKLKFSYWKDKILGSI